jgi:uncharacterized protein YndB with AHSA1/START domain
MDTGPPQLTISRVFDAPRDLVHQAFTDPDELAAWWGQIGNSLPRDEIDFDIRPGGYQRWMEVRAAEPGFRVHIHIDLTDVAHGQLLEIRQWLPDHLLGPREQGLQAFTKLDATLTTDPATAAVHRDGATWAS